MKKFILGLALAISASLSVSAQSLELHQSYDDKNSAMGMTRLIASYYWTSNNEQWNVFSWNSFSQKGISALAYGEWFVGKNIYLHGEVRVNYGNFEYKTCTPQIGFAYLLPLNNGLNVFLTPKYSYNDIAKHDLQFSINSSFENKYAYYEGYIDTNFINQFNIFAEQKGFYKLTKNLQLGACLVFNAGKDYHGNGFAHVQPYLAFRLGLY